MVDISAALTVAGQAIGIAKSLKEIQQGYDTAEFKGKMAELMSALAETKIALIDANDEIRSKDAEIATLQAALKRKFETLEYRGYQYRATDAGKPKGAPFCPICMETGSFIFVVNSHGRQTTCPKCESTFGHLTEFPEN